MLPDHDIGNRRFTPGNGAGLIQNDGVQAVSLFQSGLLGGHVYFETSAAIITPYVSWMAFASVLGAELWRRNVGKRGVD